MQSSRRIALATLAVSLISACGITDKTAGSGNGSIGCVADRQTLMAATEAYFAQNGMMPAAESDLVTNGLLREEIAAFDLVVTPADYTVVPAAGSTCS